MLTRSRKAGPRDKWESVIVNPRTIKATILRTIIYMKTCKDLVLLLILGLNTLTICGQTNENEKMSGLIIYGDGFIFGVDEPDSWKGDIEKANEYYSNVIFYKSDEGLKNAIALIQVTIFTKKDEKTEKDLSYDVETYKLKYKNLKQQEFAVAHDEYKCYSKLMYVEEEFYQYTAYINPGAKFKSGLSVAMNIPKRPATENELKAFRQIITSLTMLNG